MCGLLLWLTTLAIIAWRDRSNIAPLMLVSFPAVCQSVAIVEIDQTFLPLTTLLQVIAFKRLRNSAKYMPIAAAAFALALWGRLTTPVIICAPLLLAALCTSKLCALRTALSMLLGVLLFLFSWWLYCRLTGVDFSGPFFYLKASFMETTVGDRSGSLGKYAQNLIYLCLWGFNPFLALLFLLDGVRRLKRFRRERSISDGDTLWLCAATILLGYTVVGGSLFGFPKYQIPALPLVALCLAEALSSFKWDKVLDGFAVVSFLLFLACGDALFFLRMTLREHLACGSDIVYLTPIMLMIAFVALFAITFYEKKTPLAWKLLALAIGCNLAWSIKQTASNYSTGYIYGDKGECRRVAEVLRNNGWTNHRQLVHVEIAQLLGLYDIMGLRPQDAPTPDALAELIDDLQPNVVTLSYAIMPIGQFRKFRESPRLSAAFNNYIPYRDGHIFYWTREP